jgi:hypothetical protein
VGELPKPDGTPSFDNIKVSPPPETPPADLRPPWGLVTKEEQRVLEEKGRWIPGIGAGYRMNQPGAQGIPTTPDPAEKSTEVPSAPTQAGLRPVTIEGLSALAQEVSAKQKKEEEVEEREERLRRQYGVSKEQVSLLMHRKRRKEIESRLPPLSIEDLLLHGEIRQKVSILPSKFEPTFRSSSGEEDLFVKRMASFEEEEDKKGERRLIPINEQLFTDRYLMDRLALMNLTVGVYALNDRPLPDHLDEARVPQGPLFFAKSRMLCRQPSIILADLNINHFWFLDRVEKLLLSPDLLKELQDF